MRIKEAAIQLDGKTWTGLTHAGIISVIALVTDVRPVKGETQGFVTECGKFVDRIEGAKIALAAGQVKNLRGPMLFSEDLLDAQNR